MKTGIQVDEKLLAEAQRLTGESQTAVILNTGLRALIEREAAKRLAELGGTEPQLHRAEFAIMDE